ncbi:hypothetical protein RB200_31930 [Streptomyces sp. PmtG]
MSARDEANGYDFPDLYAAYRAHLDTCPRRHLGLLTDCVEGIRLRAAWTGETCRRATGARTDA